MNRTNKPIPKIRGKEPKQRFFNLDEGELFLFHSNPQGFTLEVSLDDGYHHIEAIIPFHTFKVEYGNQVYGDFSREETVLVAHKMKNLQTGEVITKKEYDAYNEDEMINFFNLMENTPFEIVGCIINTNEFNVDDYMNY